MSKKGRNKRDPIFPDINPEEEEERTKTIRFYETEIKRIEEKLEEREKSFSNWVRQEGYDLVNDKDLKDKIGRLESIKQKKIKEVEEIDKKLREFRDQLEDREEVEKEIRRNIKKYILSEEVRTDKTPRPETVKKELDEITQRFEISYKNRKRARQIYIQEKSKVYNGDIKVEDLPDRILNRWIDENIVTLGVVD